MRKILRIGLPLLAVTALWTATAYCEGGPKPAEQPKAKTIKELVERYDSSSCVECHEEAHGQWENSLHSRSMLGTGRTAPTIITAMEVGVKNFPYSGVKDDKDITVEHLRMCTKCHLPQLEDATDDVAREIIATIKGWQQAKKDGNDDYVDKLEETISSLNINCRVCHNRMAIIHKWSDGYAQPDTVYGSKEGAHDDPNFPKMAVAPALGESIFCGQCHGHGPNFELAHPSQCATLYGSYLFAYTAEGGSESCQECHMVKSGLGHDMQSYNSEEMRKMAVDVEVDGRSLFWRKNTAEGVIPMGIINVEITNKAGHTIPDG